MHHLPTNTRLNYVPIASLLPVIHKVNKLSLVKCTVLWLPKLRVGNQDKLPVNPIWKLCMCNQEWNYFSCCCVGWTIIHPPTHLPKQTTLHVGSLSLSLSSPSSWGTWAPFVAPWINQTCKYSSGLICIHKGKANNTLFHSSQAVSQSVTLCSSSPSYKFLSCWIILWQESDTEKSQSKG